MIKAQKRTLNQLHSGYLTGNTIVMTTLLVVAVYNSTARKFTCDIFKVTFICYMFGNSQSISFLGLFTKLQYHNLLSIYPFIALAHQQKIWKKSLILFAVAIFSNICLISAVLVFQATKIGVLIVLYNIFLDAVCFCYLYKCYKTQIGPNSVEDGSNSRSKEFVRNAKNDSKILNKVRLILSYSWDIQRSFFH